MRFVVYIIYFVSFLSGNRYIGDHDTDRLESLHDGRLCPGQCLISYDSDILMGHQMRDQERASGGPFSAS